MVSLKSLTFGLLAATFVVLHQSPYAVAITSFQPDGATAATKGWANRLGRLILQGGKWVLAVGGTVVFERAAEAATDHAIESWRQNQLVEAVHHEEQSFYNSYGTPIPVTDGNVALMMQNIDAVQSERSFVVDCMSVYWES